MSTTSPIAIRERFDRVADPQSAELVQERAGRPRRVEVAGLGDLAEPGEIVLSSHSTSEGIVAYLRRRDGTTIVRRWPAP